MQARKPVSRKRRSLLIRRMIMRVVKPKVVRKIKMMGQLIAKSRRVSCRPLQLLLQSCHPSRRKMMPLRIAIQVRKRKASPWRSRTKSNLSLLAASMSKSTEHQMLRDCPKKAPPNQMKVKKVKSFPSFNKRSHYSQKNRRRKHLKF